MNKIILITGANGGIGKDTARQLAMSPTTEKIYLACRNLEKAKAAQKELESQTKRRIFEIVLMDVSKPDNVKTAVENLKEPIDAIIMNAGGMGGKKPESITKDGVTQIFASNVLGHVTLVDELVKANKLKQVALFASSEAARGIKKMNVKQPQLKTSSEDEFASIFDGSFFNGKMDPMEAYSLVKYAGTLWMSNMAEKHPNIRFISMSPGGTQGTAAMDDMPMAMRIMYKHILMPVVLPMFGMAHSLETGAKRFVDGINNSALQSGTFYASKKATITGPVVDQSTIFPDLQNRSYQQNASNAIHRFLN